MAASLALLLGCCFIWQGWNLARVEGVSEKESNLFATNRLRKRMCSVDPKEGATLAKMNLAGKGGRRTPPGQTNPSQAGAGPPLCRSRSYGSATPLWLRGTPDWLRK